LTTAKLNKEQQELATMNYRLVFKAASFWNKRILFLRFEEVYDHCLVSYMRSVKLFDPTMGFKFSTFYYKVTENNIYKSIRDANALKRRANNDAFSLNKVVASIEREHIEVIDLLKSTDDPAEVATNKAVVSSIWDIVTEREKYILFELFFKQHTETEIGKVLGVTQTQVNRIKNQAFKKIKKVLKENG
jgi:RNA polymerase sigma factor (sigma-70 family)